MKGKGHLFISLALLFLMQAWGICWSQTTERVSVDSVGIEGDNASTDATISSNGRYVAFQSNATNLVAGDTNNKVDIFVHDRQLGITTMVSVFSDSDEGDDASSYPSISDDGRYVAFMSDATNLLGVGNDTNGWSDIFVRDRDADGDGIYDEPGEVSTVRVSVYSDETESIDPSKNPSISANGRYVAFESGGELDLTATELLFLFDVFVHDRDTDGDGIYDETGAISTVRVSEDSNRNEADGISSYPSISGDGRYVAFMSDATNLLGVGNDTNGWSDIFVRDRDADGDGIYDEVGAISTVRVSVASGGGEGNGDSYSPSISGDGRYVAFYSEADDLVVNDLNGRADVFVHDRDADADGIYDEVGAISTVRVSVASGGGEGDGDSSAPSMSADGNCVAFTSDADNLVAGDGNGVFDIFVYEGDPLPPNTTQSNENNSSGGGSCFITTAASDWVDF